MCVVHPFSINDNVIPLYNLAESVEYLGSAAAATVCIRYKGTEEIIEEAKDTHTHATTARCARSRGNFNTRLTLA